MTSYTTASSVSASRHTAQRSASTTSGRGSTTVPHVTASVPYATTDEHCKLTTVSRGLVKYAACTLFLRRRNSNTGLAELYCAVDTPEGSVTLCGILLLLAGNPFPALRAGGDLLDFITRTCGNLCYCRTFYFFWVERQKLNHGMHAQEA